MKYSSANKHFKWVVVVQLLYLVFVFLLVFVTPFTKMISSLVPGPISLTFVLVLLQLGILIVGMLFSNRKLMVNTGLVLMSLLVSLFLAEVIYRSLIDSTKNGILTSDNTSPFIFYDKELFKGYKPSSEFLYIQHEQDGGDTIQVQINSEGYRGPLIPKEKDSNEYRTLLIGDSFLGSIQVDFEKTLGQVLEQMSPDSFSFLQHGFHSYSPLLEFNWLLKRGIQYNPDIVLLFVYPNDFFSGNYVGDTGYLPYTIFDENGYPDYFDFSKVGNEKRNSFLGTLWNDLLKLKIVGYFNFHRQRIHTNLKFGEFDVEELLEMSQEKYFEIYKEHTELEQLLSLKWDIISLLRAEDIMDSETKHRIDYSCSVISKMSEFLKQRHVEFGVVYLPWVHQIPANENIFADHLSYGDYVLPKGGLQSRLENFCNKEGISFLDLYDDFIKANNTYPDRPIYFLHNGHLNNWGHALVAKAVFRRFQK